MMIVHDSSIYHTQTGRTGEADDLLYVSVFTSHVLSIRCLYDVDV